MAASTLTTCAFLYKRLYMAGQPNDIAMRAHPLLSMLRKEDGFTGNAFYYAVKGANPQGISGTFSSAQSAASSSHGLQFAASRKKKYGVISLDGEAMAAAENAGAFADLLTQETDGVLEEQGDSLAFDLYRSGNGMRGRRASASTNQITLTVADDARNFKYGMTIIADDTITGASPRTGSTTIDGVDEDAGVIDLVSAAGITSFANNDYLFRSGDPGTCMEGLEVLIPLTTPTVGESHRGVDRSTDARRYAGVRLDDTSASIEENIGKVGVMISQVGQKATDAFLNPIRYWEVVRRLGAKVEYSKGGGTADYGFEYIMVHTPAGAIKVWSDPDCPTTRGFVLNLEYCFLKHLKPFVHIIEDDGRPNLRSTTADEIEARARSMSNLIIRRPGSCGVFSI